MASKKPVAKKSVGTASGGPQSRLPTVIYIHGIGNQKLENEVKDDWDQALFGQNMGSRTRFAYWVDRDVHSLPEPEGEANLWTNAGGFGDFYSPNSLAVKTQGTAAAAKKTGKQQASAAAQEQDRAARMFSDLQPARQPGGVTVQGLHDHLAGWLASFQVDVRNFDGNPAKRRRFMQPLIDDLRANDGPYIVVSHSLGTAIAYEVLTELGIAADVVLWVTLGSPLSYDSFRESANLHLGKSEKALLKQPAGVKQWVSITDKNDAVIGLGGELKNSIDKADRDRVTEHYAAGINSSKSGHLALGYLCADITREAVYKAVGLQFRSLLGGGVITSGAQRKFECGGVEARKSRHKLMIEIADTGVNYDNNPFEVVETVLKEVSKQAGSKFKDMQIDRTLHYIVAHLSRTEMFILRGMSQKAKLPLKRVWAAGTKSTLINESINTVSAAAAQSAYRSFGDNIRWAVLDTGVEPRHPHFQTHNTIERFIVSTKHGDVVDEPGSKGVDDDGHGTHVAGIIAGELVGVKMAAGTQTVSGMATRTKLWCYKVFEQGKGDDVWIIKALDHIWLTNQKAGKLVIHGVNLSLGGAYDVESYNCGYTPMCDMLRKLWKQGVLVVIAAGNEGFAQFKNARDEVVSTSLDLSINDPANLEEAIVVGSVHKAKPHSYGVSYFSSRGPTADGRAKPDVVAPGEKIMSVSAAAPMSDYKSASFEKLYVELSGTSMAAPHVSGMLAAFLSARPEFIGQPDRVKELLLSTATDLKRDKYFQGAGMPNLMKMLLAV
jgi:subtilisin family serine protease